MTTCRDVILRGFRLVNNNSAEANEVADGLTALQSILLALPAFGMGNAWVDVDASADYTANENERVRVTVSTPVTVTLPSTVTPFSSAFYSDPFNAATLRAPLDGALVQVNKPLATTPTAQTYFYSANAGAWVELTGLTINTVFPLGPEHERGVAAMLALDMGPEFGGPVSPQVERMAQMGRTAINARYSHPNATQYADFGVNPFRAFSRVF